MTALGVNDLAGRFAPAIPLMYVIDLLPFAVGYRKPVSDGIRFGCALAAARRVSAR